MPKVVKRTFSLTEEQAKFIDAKVESGGFATASEVVREALRLLQEQDLLRAAKLDELRREVRRGLESGHSKEWNAADLKAKARSKRASKTTTV